MPGEDILTLAPPPADVRLVYGKDANQFGDLRVPQGKGPFPVVMHLHGGYWRAKYDLAHAGHLCAALTAQGLATWNLEYRRVGNVGGGWPGTFEDVVSGYRFLQEIAARYKLDIGRVAVMGHSAGGQLALYLSAHSSSVRHVISLAGVVDLQQAWDLHLSNDAVVELLGGKPGDVPDRYREADPMRLSSKTKQWLVHGLADDVVPPNFSREYVEQKKQRGEDVHLLEIPRAGHFDLIDPRTAAWPQVEQTVLQVLS